MILSASSVLLIAKYSNPAVYGNYLFYFSVFSVLAILSGFGGENILIMYGSKYNRFKNKLLGNAIIVRTIFSVIIVLFSLLYFFIFIPNENNLYLILLLIGALLSAYSNPLFFSYYRILGYFFKPILFTYISSVFFIFFLFFFNQSLNFNRICFGFFIGSFFSFVIILIDLFVKQNLSFSYKIFKKYFKESFVFSLSQTFDFFSSRLDIFIIKILLDPYSVGIYGISQKIVSLFQIIPSSFHIVELPLFHSISGNLQELIKVFEKFRMKMVEIGIFIFGLLILVHKEVLVIFFEKKYIDSSKLPYNIIFCIYFSI